MVDDSLEAPSFQALAPDSSLWLNQLERRWTALQGDAADAEGEAVIPLGNRRTSTVVRYAASPVVIAAWEDVARELGWPEADIGWGDIQRKATEDPDFKWNHPSTNHASGLLATLAEFYAGAGVTRGLTEEAATDQRTLDYVQAVEGTVRFYGESEDVIVERLAAEGRGFLDAFVAQEQVVVRWNGERPENPLVAIYPAEGTLWADHPLALLALGDDDAAAVTANQERVFHALADYLTGRAVQERLLEAGYRPADLDIPLDGAGSPFAGTDAVDWREPQTTLQIPSAAVVEVVQNVWWYTKRPTNVFLVVDTSGSMGGDKLALTKEALKAFVGQIRGDRDQVGLIDFGTGVKSVWELEPVDDARRGMLLQEIEGLSSQGETALLDAVVEGYAQLQQEEDREAINALVVMTDGQENASRSGMADLEWRFQQEGRVDVVVFTIAFGRGADEGLLRRMAELGGGQFRRADETDIEELYRIISTYF
jgi:Ca-activated chloride channel family protein